MSGPPDGVPGAPWWASLFSGLAELVLPTSCAGCGGGQLPLRYGVCARCVAVLEQAWPLTVRPEPAPVGLPPCVAWGRYEGVLREVLLGYKERGRHRLARPLGALLAGAVLHAVGEAGGRPLVLVPVPSTAHAIRERHGDHLARLAGHAARRLRAAGRPVLVRQPLRASPRPDSALLDRSGRAAAAAASIRLRPTRLDALRRDAGGAQVVVVDDVVTTGATLTAVTGRLAEAGVAVAAAAVLAATRLRRPPAPGSTLLSA